ncbi:DNA translocase FtsK [Lentilactobacillus kosonis]|uniref:DNA translocase FtsK n=1 Tax=Lentilactobacillus kosonis TaxID=2810561 RepID=A0A401FKC2_9LACO|nr:DNA translocase FtsK [Lentilactobacillus kosonis]GAY72824.1 cell division protein FtsK [Lentilactobacillus kosonis]
MKGQVAVPETRRRGLYDLFKRELSVDSDQLILFSNDNSGYDFDLDRRDDMVNVATDLTINKSVDGESGTVTSPMPSNQWLDGTQTEENSDEHESSLIDNDQKSLMNLDNRDAADQTTNEMDSFLSSKADMEQQADNVDDVEPEAIVYEKNPDSDEAISDNSEDESSDDDSSHQITKPMKKVKVRKGLSKSFKSMLNRKSGGSSEANYHSVERPSQTGQDLATNSFADGLSSEADFKQADDQRIASKDMGDKQAMAVSDHWRPSITLLDKEQTNNTQLNDSFVTDQITKLNQTLSAFKVNAEVVNYTVGPTITQFEIKLALGVKVSRITNLSDDLKLALAAKDIRIEAPIPGKSTVGIEVPNPHSRPVNLAEIIDSPEFINEPASLVAAIGEDISGTPVVGDIAKMPHALIAGATGSGKSVFINGLLTSLMYKASPADLKLLLIDPKAVELSMYSGIPHLLAPVISDPQTATQALKWVTKEMDERYEKLAAASVQNIKQFNQKVADSGEYGLKMPYILIVIDELADLMMVSSQDTEMYIARITQKARAAGIHLIVATQRPSVDVVTGTIKNNIPTRIAFAVSSQIDSRTILDTSGAEKLLGKGDMLYLQSGSSKPARLQGAFVKNDEIHRVIDYVRQTGSPQYQFSPEQLKKSYEEAEQSDPIMGDVLNYIAEEDSISTSKLQRVFSIGYNRAATIIDDLEDQHYISEQHGSKPREIYYRKNSEQE